MKKVFLFSKHPLALIFAGLMVFSSCQKDNKTGAGTDSNPSLTVDAAQSDAVSDGQFGDVFDITMGVQASDAGEDIGIGTGAGIIYKPAGSEQTLSPDSVARCFTVTVEPKTLHVFPKVVTIDFGSGCLGKDGKLRKGKIISTYSGPMFVPANTVSTTFEDYNVDSFKIEGTLSVENTSTANAISWTVKVDSGKITNTLNGFWRKWDGIREHTQTEGNSTPLNLLDDVYQITGNAKGANSNSNSWSSTITQPLIRKFTCPWIDQGQVKINRNANSAILDFGDGTCDNKATITINGVSHIISLH
ncbi:MAG: hypothetical protein Q8891_04170 [Bacteroidota bacterium]|nr:hypothetical protein [Bacteroidota bacterium]